VKDSEANVGRKRRYGQRKSKAKLARSEPTDGKFTASPFRIPGHLWVPTEWVSKFDPNDVVSKRKYRSLVRDRKGKPSYVAKPSIPEEELCRWTRERYRQEVQKFLTVDREMVANLAARAARKKSGVTPIAWKAENLINVLFQLVEDKNQEAASAVAELLQKGVGQLSQVAKNNPELLRPVAQKSWNWPVMKSTHPLLSDDDFLGNLTLGRDAPFYFDNRSKWRFDDFTRIAFSLLIWVWKARKENRGRFVYYEIGELADELPQFRKGRNADQWWRLAKTIFLFSYPKPEAIPELESLIELKKRTPSRVRYKILERIKQHFLNFAKP